MRDPDAVRSSGFAVSAPPIQSSESARLIRSSSSSAGMFGPSVVHLWSETGIFNFSIEGSFSPFSVSCRIVANSVVSVASENVRFWEQVKCPVSSKNKIIQQLS
jgi:hypothetical protein